MLSAYCSPSFPFYSNTESQGRKRLPNRGRQAIHRPFSKWRKEYEATNANQSSDACHILVPKEDNKEDEELSNGTNNQE